MIRPKSVGSVIETQCTRCRALMNHTIVAMVGEKIVRVECNTCHGTHNYHPPKPVKVPASPKAGPKRETAPRKPKVDAAATAAAEWAALQPDLDPAQAIPYDMNRPYRPKELLLHPLFGLGIVQALLAPNKIEVLFREGRKLLRCG